MSGVIVSVLDNEGVLDPWALMGCDYSTNSSKL